VGSTCFAPGSGKTILLDERQDIIRFGRTQAETAQEFIARRHLENLEVCPGRMASTAEEVAVVAPCLTSRHAHRVLIVTSAYHTRRALEVFHHRLPQYEWSVTAAPDESAYRTDWWRRRAWAKTWLEGTQRIAWWSWRTGGATGRSLDDPNSANRRRTYALIPRVEAGGKELFDPGLLAV